MKTVCIIGAGPAGCAAALILASNGWSVTLFEQNRFPRDKVCGECISALGVAVLRRLGALPSVLGAGAIQLTQAAIHPRNSDAAFMKLPTPMLGLSRAALDSLLLSQAVGAGASICQPARCEAVTPTADEVSVTFRDLQTNRVDQFSADFVLVADGKAALPGAAPELTGDLGIKSHWRGMPGPRDAIELFSCDGCYGGLAPIEDSRWNTAFSVPAARVRQHHGDLNALFDELCSESPALSQRFRSGNRATDWLASPLPRFGVRRISHPRVIPIGNAAAAIEPIGGEGMGLALRSAELAAGMLNVHGAKWISEHAHSLQSQFEQLWRVRRAACRGAAMIVSSSVADSAIDLLRCSDRLPRIVMQSIGKADRCS